MAKMLLSSLELTVLTINFLSTRLVWYKQSIKSNETGKIIIQMGKNERRNITFFTTGFANAFQAK